MSDKEAGRKTGLFFGSFNPVHIGHMIIANYMAQHTDLDEVWMVVSPQNPHKKKQTLARDYDRLHLLHLAIGDNPLLKASDIEFHLPKPSYTVETLAYIREKYPDREFALIMGGDSLSNFHRWKNPEVIIEHHGLYVYKRSSGENGKYVDHPKVRIFDAPLLEISASYIRNLIRNGFSVRYLVPDAVFHYIDSSNMYKE